MDIRLLDSTDAETWWHFRLEALEGEPLAFGSSPEDHRKISIEAAGERLKAVEQGKFVVGAFAQGKLVGTAGFVRDDAAKGRHRGMIWGVYVAPAARGKGVARGLMETIIARARRYPGLEHISIMVSASQAPAKRLYETLGFKTWGREPRALKIGDVYMDEDRMILDLRAGQAAAAQ